MIGGRWKGAHVPGYDIEKDPDHQKVCDLCHGTGKRNDALGRSQRAIDPSYGCNGCKGTGTALEWPTQFTPHEKDVLEVEACHDGLTCEKLIITQPGKETIVVKDDAWDTTEGRKTVKEILREHNCVGGVLVTVDYHC